ncbi:MAG: phosphodiester glycosidase family protein [Chloroflexi bacterium]|nr:MAG: phosphodiester glycosidase family protein [Chloroflexota bacterium]
MIMLQPVSRILHALLLIILIGTGYSIVYYLNNEPAGIPAVISTPTPVPGVSGTFGTMSDTGWSLSGPGLERRVIEIQDNQGGHVESLHIWRLDQRSFRMDVAFDERPRSLETWQTETNAALVVNGGYFSIENESYVPDGLTIVAGKTFGRSFAGFGGMLAIDESGTELRWLVEKPYDPDERFQAALQSFPVLVQPGGQLGFGAERENYARARRTVIGQDRAGRILFIVAPQGYFTLHELSIYLTGSDLHLDIAVNLDGGGSTGILVANPHEIIPSKVLLPFVILVYAR